jgi:mono/diheme cytochrome c family protein
MADRKLTPRLVIVPVVLFAYVSVMVFALAKAHPLSPAKPVVSGAPVVLGDVYRGETAFQDACAGCHGAGGTGGGVGPTLAGRGLDLSAVKAQIETGSGAMPGNLVSGDKLADVLAYVAQITES